MERTYKKKKLSVKTFITYGPPMVIFIVVSLITLISELRGSDYPVGFFLLIISATLLSFVWQIKMPNRISIIGKNEIVLTGLFNTNKFLITELLSIEKMSFQESFIILKFTSGKVALPNDFENLFDFLLLVKEINPNVTVEV